MSKENNLKYIVLDNQEQGMIKIADDVLLVIAGYAVLESKGVYSLSGNITSASINKVGMRVLSRGVRMARDEMGLKLAVTITINYGCSIPEVCEDVQGRVKSAVESMTGIKVSDVNVRVAGVKVME